jgi:hypothetical protein
VIGLHDAHEHVHAAGRPLLSPVVVAWHGYGELCCVRAGKDALGRVQKPRQQVRLNGRRPTSTSEASNPFPAILPCQAGGFQCCNRVLERTPGGLLTDTPSGFEQEVKAVPVCARLDSEGASLLLRCDEAFAMSRGHLFL